MKRRSRFVVLARDLWGVALCPAALGCAAWLSAVALVGESLHRGEGHHVRDACLAVIAGVVGIAAFWVAARRPQRDDVPLVPMLMAIGTTGGFYESWPETSRLIDTGRTLVGLGLGFLIVRLSRSAAGQGSVASSSASQLSASEATPSGSGTETTDS